MNEYRAKSNSELTPLPKSAAAATRCNGVGSSPGTTGTARRSTSPWPARAVELPGHVAHLGSGGVKGAVAGEGLA